jgi:hypothetical protein
MQASCTSGEACRFAIAITPLQQITTTTTSIKMALSDELSATRIQPKGLSSFEVSGIFRYGFFVTSVWLLK